jgi:hypothetical protein
MKNNKELSALRYNSDKLNWSLIDFDSLEDMVKVLEFGANKYSADNWKKGLPRTEIIESLLRHTFAYLQGEDNDKDSGLSHTGHILCNAMFLSYMHKYNPKSDDRRIDENKSFDNPGQEKGLRYTSKKTYKDITEYVKHLYKIYDSGASLGEIHAEDVKCTYEKYLSVSKEFNDERHYSGLERVNEDGDVRMALIKKGFLIIDNII